MNSGIVTQAATFEKNVVRLRQYQIKSQHRLCVRNSGNIANLNQILKFYILLITSRHRSG